MLEVLNLILEEIYGLFRAHKKGLLPWQSRECFQELCRMTECAVRSLQIIVFETKQLILGWEILCNSWKYKNSTLYTWNVEYPSSQGGGQNKYGRQSNTSPRVSVSWSSEPVGVFCHIAEGTLQIWWCPASGDEEVIVFYPSGPNVITDSSKREREQESQRQKKKGASPSWVWNPHHFSEWDLLLPTFPSLYLAHILSVIFFWRLSSPDQFKLGSSFLVLPQNSAQAMIIALIL